MTVENLLKALSTVQEPDLGKDLVTLNMVRDIEINDSHVSFTVILTTPACPLKAVIEKDCINAIKANRRTRNGVLEIKRTKLRAHCETMRVTEVIGESFRRHGR